MEQSKKRQNIIKAAKLYYYGNMSQEEIAQIMEVSRPKVSRMLSEARTLNIVQIVINDPGSSLAQTAQQLQRHFGLKYVKVVSTQNTGAATQAAVGMAASNFLNEQIDETSNIGISWGTTLSAFVHEFVAKRTMAKATIVQLVGGTYSQSMNIDARELVRDMAKKLECKHSILQAPLIVHNPKLRNMLMEEPDTKAHFSRIHNLDMAFVGIGSTDYKDSIVYRTNYAEESAARIFNEIGMVCDICGHQIMPDGSAPPTFLTDRVIGVSLEDLHRIPLVVGLCEGKKKAAPLLAALRGGHVNCVITDEVAALKLLAEEHL